MKFSIGKIDFFPRELIQKPSHVVIVLLLVIVFSNVFTMWGEAFAGNLPYGSREDFQTLDGAFKYTLILSKFTTAAEELSALNDAFNKFKAAHPLHKDSTLYRTSAYYHINVWMFWKWYRYFETGHILSYPYLNTKTILK